jgi:hypothetical protein
LGKSSGLGLFFARKFGDFKNIDFDQ